MTIPAEFDGTAAFAERWRSARGGAKGWLERSPGVALAALFALAMIVACPVSAAPGEDPWTLHRDAHTKLTDGVTAAPLPGDSAWVTLYGDSTILPRTRYNPGEFSFWGMNAPIGLSPTRTPSLYVRLIQANIRGVRYDMLWNAAQFHGPDSMLFDALGVESDINAYAADGFSVVGVVGYTPAWANGLKNREYPPNNPVEGELIQFNSDEEQLSKFPVITTLQNIFPVAVTPVEYTTERVEEEIITTSFSRGMQPRCSRNPVVVGTETVWVDENDGRGWVQWTRVDNLIYSPDGAEHYEFDRSGRVKFRNNEYYYYHGKTPAFNSRVKISYDVITSLYKQGVDYVISPLDGKIIRVKGDISGYIPEEEFDSAPLDGRWSWINEPTSWDVGQTTPGMLAATSSNGTNTIGHFLHQDFTGDGDFSVYLRVNKMTNGQCGIAVYQDASNWFRYCVTSSAGRPFLVSSTNGTVTSFGGGGELGFLINPPCWVVVRKSGDTFTVFTSSNNPEAPDGGFHKTYTFSRTFQFPLKVGISFAGASQVELDKFWVKLPSIPAGGQVRVFYNYMNTKPFTDFLKRWVGHFKDRVKFWEVWNEPDQGWVWQGGTELYSVLLRDAYQAIKEADPDARVLNGGFADSATGRMSIIYNTIGKEFFDFAAWHPYNFRNLPPDSYNWGPGNSNGIGRAAMIAAGDEDKMVFFGELGTTSAVAAAGGGLNDWKQAEYGVRQFLWARRLGYPRAVQWYPAVDEAPVGQGEDSIWREHSGIFYYGSGLPKPVYWITASAAKNKGVLLDLATYDAAGNRIPQDGMFDLTRATVGVYDRSKVAAVRVYTSRTATDPSCRPPLVAARHIGQAGAAPFAVTVNTGSSSLLHEQWTATAVSPTEFQVTASVSGTQGIATVGVPFVSDNGVVQFTIPAVSKPYVAGDRFEFETFAGDGFELAGEWTNDGSVQGPGIIEIPLAQGTRGRYVSIQFVKAPSTRYIKVDEIAVFDTANTNVAAGKLYIVDGYQKMFDSDGIELHLSEIAQLPDGTRVDVTGKVLHFKQGSIGYLQEPDRSSGLRIDGNLSAIPRDSLVNVSGLISTTSGGERRILVDQISVVGTASPVPLAANNRDLKSPMMNGLYVRAYGRVKPGSITTFTYEITDGSDQEGILISTPEVPDLQPGQFVTVTGAAGFNNRRVIYERWPRSP
ncbi:MAG: hypothetical protein WHZ52_05630 [Armatimonadota bacterium]